MTGNSDISERYNALKAAMHAILDEATRAGATPKVSLARIQKISAGALLDTFTAKLQLVPTTHRVVPIESTPGQLEAALGKHFGPEDELMARNDYKNMVLAAPETDAGDNNE